MVTSSRPSDRGPLESLGPADRSPPAVWQWLSQRETESWLDEIGSLRAEHDDLERSFDIWCVALIAALREPGRREVAARVIARLRKLADTMDES